RPDPRAGAAPPASSVLVIRQGTALAEVTSMSSVPEHFSSTATQALVAAEHTPTLQSLHRRMHPLRVVPYVWRGQHPFWYVEFTYQGKLVADVNVSPGAKVTGVWTGAQATAPYTHGGWASVLASWWILLPASVLFVLAFLDPRRLRRLAHLDGLAVLAFLASYVLLADAHLEAAVWLAYPPLIYLLVRLLRVGFRGNATPGRLAPLLGTRVLAGGLVLMLGARIAISLLGHQEIDVGSESVYGAYRLIHHLPLYWADPNHGDTYGPITYLAYVPFELLFPWTGALSNLHAADAAAIFFDLATVGGLIPLGRRLREGAAGKRLGLVLAWAWAACPFTIIGLIVHTNDGLVAMLTVFALLALTTPVVSGALLGLAAAAKFSPAALLPLLAAPRQRGVKGACLCIGAFTVVVVTAIVSWLPPDGLSYFWQRTIEFQIHRFDVFSPWALHPSLHPIQTALEVLTVLIAAAVAFVPRERSLVQVCALAGAVSIAIQLPATHWYYYYIMWFLPFALAALLGWPPAAAPESASDRAGAADLLVARNERELVLPV
ncbi:MAG: glycosyltransferase 87 family protein, partial [Actinomycetota bacterium]|nr:glycosyltransferase 87 family protein [Actinomycetota bacterium]